MTRHFETLMGPVFFCPEPWISLGTTQGTAKGTT
jgi:hypothetical protein